MNLKKHLGLIAALVLACSLTGIAQTQDTPVTVTDTTIADLTNDATVFHGQTVRLQGTITNFLSPNIFILAEDAVIAQDGVLVINNTGLPLANALIEGRVVSVTGFVHPSYDVVTADPAMRFPSFYDDMGGMMTFPGMMQPNTSMMPTVDPAMMPTVDPAMAMTTDPAMVPTMSAEMTTMSAPVSTVDPAMPTTDPAMMPTLDPAVAATFDPANMPTVDPAMMPGGNMPSMNMPFVWDDALVAVYNGGYLPDGFGIYTIIELRDTNQIAVTPPTP